MSITLNSNRIYNALNNMIISQYVFADNIKGNSEALVNKARVDGTLFGDQKIYYSTDCLESQAWGADSEAENLLKLHRPKAAEVQAITLDVFRMIPVTVDNYLTKQAWMDEGSFGSFTSVTLGWLGDTKRIYDKKTYNAFIGTAETNVGKQEVTITLPANPTTKDDYAMRAMLIAKGMEDLIDDLEDANRSYNDYGHLRESDGNQLEIVINSKYANEIKKIDLPTIFHDAGLETVSTKLHYKFFGTVATSNGTTDASNTTIRSMIEKDYGSGASKVHVLPGDLLPNSTNYTKGEVYTEDDSIIFKIYGKLPPYMSAFEVQTVFFNPRSLTESHFLIFGRNTLQYLKNYPCITVRETNPVVADGEN